MVLHWVLAIVVLALATVVVVPAFVQAHVPVLRGWHHGLGLAVVPLAVVLMAWRLRGRVPAPETTLFDWQLRVLAAARVLLYAHLLVLPPLGYLAASARDAWVRVFAGSFLPGVALSPAAAPVVVAAHRTLAWTFLALVAVHVGIALYHHFLLRDRLLRRMLPP